MPYKLLRDESSPSLQSQSPESWEDYALRTVGRTAARAGEALGGYAGNAIEAAKPIGKQVLRYASGAAAPLIEAGLEKAAGKPEVPSVGLPTSEGIKENVTKKLTGEYLEPQGEGEKFWDDLVGDTVSLMAPLPGIKGTKFGKAAFQSIAGNTSKQAVKAFTGSETAGDVAKFLTSVLAGTAGGRKAIEKQKTEAYKIAEPNLTVNDVMKTDPTIKELHKLRKEVASRDFKSKPFVLERLDHALNEFAKEGTENLGTIEKSIAEAGGKNFGLETSLPVQKFIDTKKDLNKYIYSGDIDKDARKYLGETVNLINKDIAKFGKTKPEWYQPWKVGEELTQGLNATGALQRVLNIAPKLIDEAGNPEVREWLKWGLKGAGIGVLGHAYVHPTTGLPLIGSLAAAQQGAKTAELIRRSPIAAKHYKSLLEAAASNNLKVAAKDISAISKEQDKWDKKNPEPERPKKYRLLD